LLAHKRTLPLRVCPGSFKRLLGRVFNEHPFHNLCADAELRRYLDETLLVDARLVPIGTLHFHESKVFPIRAPDSQIGATSAEPAPSVDVLQGGNDKQGQRFTLCSERRTLGRHDRQEVSNTARFGPRVQPEPALGVPELSGEDGQFGWQRARAHEDEGLSPPVDASSPKSESTQGAVTTRPNGSRLSCGALKRDSFLNLRAPPASSAC
jgi:hypothetical protein